MVRPCAFGFNPQTAANNAFQQKGHENKAQENALREFDGYVELLRSNGVKVNVVDDTPSPHTPDSIFPNNWFSTHSDGTLVLYPMFAPNRRAERKEGVLDYIIEKFDVQSILDLTSFENDGLFLEGTGSMVIDRASGVVFACRSPRTSEVVLQQFCKNFGWKYFLFNANDASGSAIYHTNVLMCIGSKVAVVCMSAITDHSERDEFESRMKECGKEIVDISFDQMNNFAGNMLELHSDQPLIIMSATARRCLHPDQVAKIEKSCRIVSPEINCIEVNGGGSARCMLAEIYLKKYSFY